MDPRYFDLLCDTQTPELVTDANGVEIDPADLRITHGETLVLRCTVETDGVAVDLTGLVARLTAKDPDDRDATTPLLYSVDNSDGWTDLGAGLVAITVATDTAALSAFLTDRRPERRVLLSIHLYDGATGAPYLASELQATAVRPAEATGDNTPPPALNGVLAAIAALASVTAGTIIEITSTAGAVALRTITATGKSLVAAASASAARTVLELGTIATAAATAYALIAHGHSGTTDGSKLAQANTHETPDTDAGASSLHHTIGTGAAQAAAGSHTTDTANPHSVTAAQAGAPALSLLTADGNRPRATAESTWGQTAPLASLGTIAPVDGTANVTLTPDAFHTATIGAGVTVWVFSGLEIGEGCTVRLTNASLYVLASTGLGAAWTGALADLSATADVRLVIWREAAGYYGVAKSGA